MSYIRLQDASTNKVVHASCFIQTSHIYAKEGIATKNWLIQIQKPMIFITSMSTIHHSPKCIITGNVVGYSCTQVCIHVVVPSSHAHPVTAHAQGYTHAYSWTQILAQAHNVQIRLCELSSVMDQLMIVCNSRYKHNPIRTMYNIYMHTDEHVHAQAHTCTYVTVSYTCTASYTHTRV